MRKLVKISRFSATVDSDESDVDSDDSRRSLLTVSQNVMDQDSYDRSRLDNHADRIEHIESQIADVIETNSALNETIKQLLQRMEDKERESPMMSAPTSPMLAQNPTVTTHPLAPGALAIPPIVTAPTPDNKSRIKPSPPAEFSGERSKGRAFLNSCELYIRLAPHQFESEKAKIAWAYSFMKSGRAALFVDRTLRYEGSSGVSRYATWGGFKMAFIDEFFPKNERQRALTTLETTTYYQGKRTMDDYVDSFRDLIDLSGYTEGFAIVMKFRRGLRRDIQDQIAQLASGRPGDNDPSGCIKRHCAAQRISSPTPSFTVRQRLPLRFLVSAHLRRLTQRRRNLVYRTRAHQYSLLRAQRKIRYLWKLIAQGRGYRHRRSVTDAVNQDIANRSVHSASISDICRWRSAKSGGRRRL